MNGILFPAPFELPKLDIAGRGGRGDGEIEVAPQHPLIVFPVDFMLEGYYIPIGDYHGLFDSRFMVAIFGHYFVNGPIFPDLSIQKSHIDLILVTVAVADIPSIAMIDKYP